MPIATLYSPRELVVSLREPLRCTWHEKARGLMWTEFVPVHEAEKALRQAEWEGDTGRATAIRKALEARRRTELATCAPERADRGDGQGGGGR